MDAETLARARGVVEGLRGAAGYSRSVTVTYRTEGGSVEFYPPPSLARWLTAAPALLALAEAVVERRKWADDAMSWAAGGDNLSGEGINRALRQADTAIDAAIAQLAALTADGSA